MNRHLKMGNGWSKHLFKTGCLGFQMWICLSLEDCVRVEKPSDLPAWLWVWRKETDWSSRKKRCVCVYACLLLYSHAFSACWSIMILGFLRSMIFKTSRCSINKCSELSISLLPTSSNRFPLARRQMFLLAKPKTQLWKETNAWTSNKQLGWMVKSLTLEWCQWESQLFPDSQQNLGFQ